MMAILERIVRFLLGVQPRSCPLAALFQDDSDAEKAIVLKESGFPYGGVTTLTWWKTASGEFFRKARKEYGETETRVDPPIFLHGTSECVEDMLSELDEFDQLGNCRGRVRDGVIYHIAWGTRSWQRTLTINNPPADSRHCELVRQVKERAVD